MSFVCKTASEQRLDWLQGLKRPLTDAESDQLRKSLHAVYEQQRRARLLAMHEEEEARLIKSLERESRMRSDLS